MTGLDHLAATGFKEFHGLRVGLVTHPAAISNDLKTSVELFQTHTKLVTLFGPEHGFRGDAQDLIPVGRESDVRTIPCHSLYGDTFESLTPTAEMLKGIDVLVIDMQDVGSRYYTFQATMLYCLQACAKLGIPVAVLDRPNPLGETIEGPTVRPGFESFVGPRPIPIRHGQTMAQLAKHYRQTLDLKLDLTTIGDCRRDVLDTFVVPPSPNMPTVATAVVYPGGCLYEGTNLSEGRGTTRPFEYVGHPHLDADRFADELNAFALPGVKFLPAVFRPTFQKHAGRACGGCMTVVTNRKTFKPVRMGLAVLMAAKKLLGSKFVWRTERYEFVDHIPAIDLLFGSDRERLAIDAGASFEDITAAWTGEEQMS